MKPVNLEQLEDLIEEVAEEGRLALIDRLPPARETRSTGKALGRRPSG
jgi:hypothetical protein